MSWRRALTMARELAMRAPPFAREIRAADELVMIYCGPRAWELARPEGDRLAALVFPHRSDPASYRWPVKDKQVLILAMGMLRTLTDPLVMELLHQRAACVAVYEDGALTYYDPRNRAS
jgi:hypothetical protein